MSYVSATTFLEYAGHDDKRWKNFQKLLLFQVWVNSNNVQEPHCIALDLDTTLDFLNSIQKSEKLMEFEIKECVRDALALLYDCDRDAISIENSTTLYASDYSTGKISLHIAFFDHVFQSTSHFSEFLKRYLRPMIEFHSRELLKVVDWGICKRNQVFRCYGMTKFKDANNKFLVPRRLTQAKDVENPTNDHIIEHFLSNLTVNNLGPSTIMHDISLLSQLNINRQKIQNDLLNSSLDMGNNRGIGCNKLIRSDWEGDETHIKIFMCDLIKTWPASFKWVGWPSQLDLDLPPLKIFPNASFDELRRDPDGNKIYLYSSENRFCIWKKDYHKSNRIVFIIDKKKKTITTKCMDDQCRRDHGNHGHKITPGFIF